MFYHFSRDSSLLLSRHKLQCRDISLSSAFSYVATCVEMSRHCLLLALVFSALFLALFASFDLDSCKTVILVKIP